MNILNRSAISIIVLAAAPAVIGCRGSNETDASPGESPVVEEITPGLGEMAEVRSPGDTAPAGGGYVVVVRRKDGSTVPAVFRGPSKLAELASGGDYEFHEDSLPSRVRLLEPGQELRRPGGEGR